MKLPVRNIILLILMLASAGLAVAMRPTHKIADEGQAVDLQAMIPRTFGDWREEPQPSAQIVDPQQAEMIAKIYTQTLSRTYINPRGYRVMLSIAYGEDQRDSVQLHYPEVCYPAQGFQVLSSEQGTLVTEFGGIRVKHLVTKLGERSEPVTYWTTLGKQVVQGGMDTKIVQLKFGIGQKIPDGLLFRISSIDPLAASAYEAHQAFVLQLLRAVTPEIRQRLAPMN